MSEKLLQKPPFRYIFDIFIETTKATGFATNLFEGEELNPSQQKEVKLQFLSKMKDLVQLMTGEELAVKPTRIIAGHEPENTNILLQTVYTLATSGQDSQPFVKKVLGKYNSESLKAGKTEEPPAKPQENDKEKQRQKKKQEQEQEEERKKMERRKQREQQKEQERKKQEEEQQQQQQQLQAKPQQQQQMRPQSGYKKPPKIKDNLQTEEKQAKSGPKIIRENAKQQDEDLFVDDNGPKNQGIKLSNIDAKRHGKFVNEALQEDTEEPTIKGQQPQMEEGSKIKMSKVGQRGIKARSKQSQQQTEMIGKDDIETLTNLIQSICQNANPLGKSLEFLNDDIESMNKEREYWRKQFEVSRDKYQQEQRTTEDLLQPLLDKNMQIDENIEEVKQKIQNTKAQIIKNTTIIQNLLFSVVQNKQQ
eukprot:TRINITY_DN4403_c0_g1_i1.p1 TRINITY_DN4403_c0_g1~~TRINITY_DN4403_c0_g1_i1.p1  ORF type:complete len:462 (+),score=105.79 TRINITY_DN4403_c0_g1_i1:128-1387(+)